MSTEENKALVRRYYHEVLNGRQVEVLDELLDPGFKSRFGDYEVGCAGYRAAVLRTLGAFADLRVEILDQLAEGDLVATRWRARGAAPHPEGGERRSMTLSAMHFHRVAGNRLVEHWEELDSARLATLFG